MKRYSVLTACLTVAGLALSGTDWVSTAVAQALGAQAFNQCRACHTLQSDGRNGAGPNLHGLFGREAGSSPGFNYSPALKASGLRWDDDTLDRFLAAPQKAVPGSRMPVSVSDPARRAALINYLKGQTAN